MDSSDGPFGIIATARNNLEANMTLAAMDWQLKFFIDWIRKEEGKKNRNIMLRSRRFVVSEQQKASERTKTGRISKKKPGHEYIATVLLTGARGVVQSNFRDILRHYHEVEVKHIMQSHAAWKDAFKTFP
jgi:hypothetical protein